MEWEVFCFFLLPLGNFRIYAFFEDLENPDSNLATEVISADQVVIGKFFRKQITTEILTCLKLGRCLSCYRGRTFYEHSGIDGRGTLRAIASLGTSGGASTLTQQLAKQLFHGEGSKFLPFRIIQSKEWIIAIRLERQYTKTKYLPCIAMCMTLVITLGVSSAAQTYFSKTPKELTIDESAILVGMFKNSGLYNPVRNPQGKNRRNVVLSQMEKSKMITEAQN
jgi:penicillin-binding protein 1A